MSETTDPYWNIAMEEAILLSGEKNIFHPTIRFWINSDAAVIGIFQDPSLEVDLKFCSDMSVAVIRRFTGGGAVYHDLGNLNWSVFISRKHRMVLDVMNEGLPGIFKVLSRGIVEGLSSLGLSAQYKFPNSILAGGKKISGIAGSVKVHRILCHGTLLVNSDLDRLWKVLTPNYTAIKGKIVNRHVRSTRSEVTTLDKELVRPIGIEQVKIVLTKAVERVYGIRLEVSDLTYDEKKCAEKLHQEKYLKDMWNYTHTRT
mgnify:CR=1 FL=1